MFDNLSLHYYYKHNALNFIAMIVKVISCLSNEKNATFIHASISNVSSKIVTMCGMS